MDHLLPKLCSGKTPFCIIQKQDSEDCLILTGNAILCNTINDIPRKRGSHPEGTIYDTISIVPFSQIKERGYRVRDVGEKIITIRISSQHVVETDQLMQSIPREEISLKRAIEYDTSEEDYCRLINDIVEKEIGNGQGANFVIPRNGEGQFESFSATKALTIFRSLVENDYGTYWKFIFYDTSRFFIGSTPERHLLVQDGKVKMNPISGTMRKDRQWARRTDFKKDLLNFLTDRKEINELFMVVDEELKMMAKMCDQGGAIIGPLLKEMSHLIHSEYLLSGESDKDIFELFTDSMFAATVVGSPVENACNIIAKYAQNSRRYYGSALMLVGRDENGRDFLDSPISIRTAEIDTSGKMHFSVGATLVKDSQPQQELEETKAKSAALLAGITATNTTVPAPPLLAKLYNDDEIAETMALRNQNLSKFWFYNQAYSRTRHSFAAQVKITIIDNEDDFVHMLKHMLDSMGAKVSIVRYDDYHFDRDQSHITILGPGPGNPNENEVRKIALNNQICAELLSQKKLSLFICLGHQFLCKSLGFSVERKKNPLQGTQMRINLFDQEEEVGFYNTFAPKLTSQHVDFECAILPEDNELVAIRGSHFVGYQFHPESILTKNGYSIIKDTIEYLLGTSCPGTDEKEESPT